METIVVGKEFKEKYSFRETCFGIVINNNKILLVKKNNQYSLVGGGREENESYLDCLKREFLEETGYDITSYKELVTIDCYWLADNKYPLLSRANIFEVSVDLENKNSALEEDMLMEWIDIEKCIDILPLPYHKSAIEWYIKKRNG